MQSNSISFECELKTNRQKRNLVWINSQHVACRLPLNTGLSTKRIFSNAEAYCLRIECIKLFEKKNNEKSMRIVTFNVRYVYNIISYFFLFHLFVSCLTHFFSYYLHNLLSYAYSNPVGFSNKSIYKIHSISLPFLKRIENIEIWLHCPSSMQIKHFLGLVRMSSMTFHCTFLFVRMLTFDGERTAALPQKILLSICWSKWFAHHRWDLHWATLASASFSNPQRPVKNDSTSWRVTFQRSNALPTTECSALRVHCHGFVAQLRNYI